MTASSSGTTLHYTPPSLAGSPVKWVRVTKPDGTSILIEARKAYRIEPAPSGPSVPNMAAVIWFQGEPPVGVRETINEVEALFLS